jgi:hypothetical protein
LRQGVDRVDRQARPGEPSIGRPEPVRLLDCGTLLPWASAATPDDATAGTVALEQAIRTFVATYNETPQPFVRTNSADEILAASARFCTCTLAVHRPGYYVSNL